MRVPTNRVKSTVKAIRKRDNVDNFTDVSNSSRSLQRQGAKAIRIRNVATDDNVARRGRTPAGANRDYYLLDPEYASKHILKGSDKVFRPSKNQRLHINARERYGKGNLDRYVEELTGGKTPRRPYVDRRGGVGRSTRRNLTNVQRSEANYFKPGRRQVDVEKAVKNIQAQLTKAKDGFTVDPRTGRTPTRGTQVAIDGRVLRDTSEAGIRRFVERNKAILSRPDVKVGGWVSQKSGKPVVELSRRVRSSSEATRLGKKFDQEGVWQNKQGQYQATGGSDLLRQTRGRQTAGGARIGGQRQVARLKANRSGTVKRPVSATKRLKRGLSSLVLVSVVLRTSLQLVEPKRISDALRILGICTGLMITAAIQGSGQTSLLASTSMSVHLRVLA
jgi:hypothetical protein